MVLFCAAKKFVKVMLDKTGVINDLLGQTHNLARSDHYSHFKGVWFCAILKSGR